MTGGVRKRGSTWSYYFDLGKVDGKRKKKEKGGFHTKKEAEAALTKAVNEYNNSGMVFEPSTVTLSDYLDFWMDNYCKVNMKQNTVTAYDSAITKHIKPSLGGYRIKSLSAASIQKWVNQLKADGYSKASMALYKRVLSCALSYAVHPMQYIQFNPCQQVMMPKMENKKEIGRYIISAGDFQKIISRFDAGTPYYIPLMVGYYTGMRLNEVFALTWDDIDLDSKEISVSKTMVWKKKTEGCNSRWIFGSAKSATSIRKIKFGGVLHKALKDARHAKNLNRIKYGEDFIECYYEEIKSKDGGLSRALACHRRAEGCKLPVADMVCIRKNGKYLPSSSIYTTACKTINDDLGIKFNFHSLRHTHATMLLENGASIKSVQERLGHANVSITLDIYDHLTKKQEDEAVSIFEQATKTS